MPVSSFSPGLQKVIALLPGTYGTALLRNHAMGGAFREMERLGFPAPALDAFRDGVDCNLYFFGSRVSMGAMYLVLVGSIGLLIGLYIAMNRFSGKKG